ncbi:hypothetical protein HYV89_02200 [Candidatus Woesearchaeota archaeon]|nr:hypothetical protein [Candidatus Woesearchaeota archaeon]
MRRDAILDSLGIFGSTVTALSFIEKPFFQRNKIVLLVLGIITLGVYFKLYIEEKAISRIRTTEKKLNSMEDVINNRMSSQDVEISKIKGWIEAINFFKGKKGAIDPITLIIILVIVIVIILALQGKL